LSDRSEPDPDTDGDGLTDAEELNLYGTSPVMPDTDGDGFNDYDEVMKYAFDPASNPYRFNPRVADLPQMAVVIAGPPVVTIQTTDEKGVTNTVENSRADGVTASVTDGISNTNSRSDTFSTSQTNTHEVANEISRTASREISLTVPVDMAGQASADAGTSARDGGSRADASRLDASRLDGSRVDSSGADSAAADSSAADTGGASEAAAIAGATLTTTQGDSTTTTLTLTDSVSNTVNPSVTFATDFTLSHEQTQENSVVLTDTLSAAQSQNLTAQGGFLKVGAIIENRGSLAFRVTNIVLAATLIDVNGAEIPLQNLFIDEGDITTFVPFSLAPGERTGVTIFVTLPLTLDAIDFLLYGAQALVVRLATYELSNASGTAFSFSATEVAAKTALVAIDYGRLHPTELHQVATNFDPGHPGVTAAKVLGDILHIPYVATPDAGLESVRALPAADAGEGARWQVDWLHNDGTDMVDTGYGAGGERYDFDSIEVHAGDVLHLALGSSAPTTSDGGMVDLPAEGIGPEDGGVRVTTP
jgi:hypothetical protein